MAMIINGDHHLAFLSVITATIGSYAALDMVSRFKASPGRRGTLWLWGGAITMGFIIYIRHFIGISSLHLSIPIFYHPWLSLLSLLIAILGSGIAFVVMTRKEKSKFHLLCGSISLGLGIVSMHYIAMSAMSMTAKIHYHPALFGLSIVTSILVSGGVLWLAFCMKSNKQDIWFLQKVGGAVAMGLSVSIVHHMGISAASFTPIGSVIPSISTATVGNVYLRDILILTNAFWGIVLLLLGTQTSWEREAALEEVQFHQQRGFNSEQRLLDTFEQAAVGIAQVSPEGKWLRLNPKYCEILGYTQEELMNLTFQEVTHPGELETNISLNQKLFIGEIDNYSLEKRYIRKDNSSVWVNLMVSLVRDEQQRPLYSIAVAEDITERKQAEEALQRSRERERFASEIIDGIRSEIELEAIVHKAAYGIGQLTKADRCIIWLYDPITKQLQIPDLNREYCSSSEITPISAILKNFPKMEQATISDFPVFPYALGYSKVANLPDVYQIEGLTETDYEVIRARGIKSLLHVPILYNEQFLGVIRVHSVLKQREWDEETISLTELIAARLAVAISHANALQKLKDSEAELKAYASKLEESNRDLEHFATVASHDLQAPLRKVLIFSGYIQDSAGGKLTEEEQDYIARMQKAIAKMQTLIDDLLGLSRVTRKGKPFLKTDLHTLVDEVLLDLQPLLDETEGRVEIGEMVNAAVDSTQIQSLLFNLIENALKFHRKDAPPIVKVSAYPTDENHYEIIVSDNGIGIKEEYLHKIFEIFSRLHGESEYPGTGVGLALSKKIAERHGGMIAVDSQPGIGSTFRVRLPFQPARTLTPEAAR